MRCLLVHMLLTLLIFPLYGFGQVKEDDLEKITTAAEKGDIIAQFKLGEIFWLEKKDATKAFEWYSKAAEQGLAEANLILGYFYDTGKGVQRDSKKAFESYNEAANQGSPIAQHYMGTQYYRGQNVDTDYKKAFEWYSISAEQGYDQSQHNLGVLYYSGQGVEQDYEKALYWFAKAAEQGHVIAQTYVAWMYYLGQGTSQNYPEAFKWCSKAAERGDAEAQNMLGGMYREGQGIPKDYSKAFVFFTKAAEQGNAKAQNHLGSMYFEGLGTHQDLNNANIWFTKSADQGNISSQRMLSQIYIFGLGVKKNYSLAVKWMTKAAEQGDVLAQRNLGMLYNGGVGVQQDNNLAIKWLDLAAKQGDAFSINRLGDMYCKQGKYSTATEKYISVLNSEGNEVDDLINQVHACLALTDSVFSRGNISEEADLYYKAIQVSEQAIEKTKHSVNDPMAIAEIHFLSGKAWSGIWNISLSQSLIDYQALKRAKRHFEKSLGVVEDFPGSKYALSQVDKILSNRWVQVVLPISILLIFGFALLLIALWGYFCNYVSEQKRLLPLQFMTYIGSVAAILILALIWPQLVKVKVAGIEIERASLKYPAVEFERVQQSIKTMRLDFEPSVMSIKINK